MARRVTEGTDDMMSPATTLTTAEIVSRLRAMPSPTRLAAADRLEQLTDEVGDAQIEMSRLEAERDSARGEMERLAAERDVLRAALSRIALGDGYYGAQAREYKQVARAALAGQPEPAVVGPRPRPQ